MKPIVSYLIYEFLRHLNDQHDQNFAGNSFCHLIDSLHYLTSKRPFSVIVLTFTDSSTLLWNLHWFYKVNVRITFLLLVICRDEHLLDWSNFGLLDYPYIIFWKIFFKCEYQIWSSGFWGKFIWSLNHHYITLHYMF